MSVAINITGTLAEEPLRVEDPWGIGWAFLCVRSTARIFRPLKAPAKEQRARLSAAVAASQLVPLLHDGTANEIPEELFDEFVDKAEALEKMGESNHPAEAVASAILGWEGIVRDDGTPEPFSREAAVSMLSDEGDCAVMDGNAPLIVGAGEWAGYTIGRALRAYIPAAIETLTTAEAALVQEKKVKSTPPNSSPRGSGTGRRTKKPAKRDKGGA